MAFEPIDAVRTRIIIEALKDVARTRNPMVFPLALALRRAQQNVFQPGEVLIGRALSTRRDEHIPILGGLLPFVKELSPLEFSALVQDIKANGRMVDALVEGHKAGSIDYDELNERFKPLRSVAVGYTAAGEFGRSLKRPGSLPRRIITSPFRSIYNNWRQTRYMLASDRTKRLMEQGLKGGPGSGNHGHTGRPGGGSNPTIPRGMAAVSGVQAVSPGEQR